MLICDDLRRCLHANVAACLFMRLAPDVILSHGIDVVIAEEQRAALDATWRASCGAAGPPS
ncbi:MAG TPA: hypothetical protein VNT54_10520 [Solirubrobacteraceae bacterium]|nr:hypothetical protein [Solirubrobacteraceae bacterium]